MATNRWDKTQKKKKKKSCGCIYLCLCLNIKASVSHQLPSLCLHSKGKERKVKSLSCMTLCDPWTVAYQAPPSMEVSRQEYWSGLPFPSPEDLPNPGIKPRSPMFQADALPSEPLGKSLHSKTNYQCGTMVLQKEAECINIVQPRLRLCCLSTHTLSKVSEPTPSLLPNCV